MLAGLKDVPALPGIYAIVNVRNGKRYVGSSKNMRERLRAHEAALRRGAHGNDHLTRAWGADGPEAFACAVIAHVESPEMLLTYEQRYIDILRCAEREHGYNASAIAGRPFHSPEVRAKMSAAAKRRGPRRLSQHEIDAFRKRMSGPRGPMPEAQRAAISAGMKQSGIRRTPEQIASLQAARRAKVLSDESRARMSAAGKTRVRGPYAPHSPETKAKISESLKARARANKAAISQEK